MGRALASSFLAFCSAVLMLTWSLEISFSFSSSCGAGGGGGLGDPARRCRQPTRLLAGVGGDANIGFQGAGIFVIERLAKFSAEVNMATGS